MLNLALGKGERVTNLSCILRPKPVSLISGSMSSYIDAYLNSFWHIAQDNVGPDYPIPQC